jgi:hypothetical protein
MLDASTLWFSPDAIEAAEKALFAATRQVDELTMALDHGLYRPSKTPRGHVHRFGYVEIEDASPAPTYDHVGRLYSFRNTLRLSAEPW